MFDINTLDASCVTFDPIEFLGTEFQGYSDLNLSLIYVPPMSENLVRVAGLDANNIDNIVQSFSNGIDYTLCPPIVYPKSQIVNGVHYKYVLVAGHHRFAALEKLNFTKWIFAVYELAKNGYSFEDSRDELQLIENNKRPQKESTIDDVANTISRMISHGSKLVTNDEASIRDYVNKVCSNKSSHARGSIVAKVVRLSGAHQSVVTYTASDVKKWLTQNTDYVNSGSFDSSRKKHGWSVKEGYEYEYVMNATRKFAETGRESYFICHTKSPTDTRDLNTKRIEMMQTFQILEGALKDVCDYYIKNQKFPWSVEGFLPQDHDANENIIIKP